MPVVLVGTRIGDRANFMAVGWCCRANLAPPMLCCGIARAHATPAGIRETGTFSVNVPSAAQLEAVDYCGLVSGATTDKSGVFEVVYGELGPRRWSPTARWRWSAGSRRSSPCRRTTWWSARSWRRTRTRPCSGTGGSRSPGADPLLLTMPDNTYRSLGRERGGAWSAGLALKAERGD